MSNMDMYFRIEPATNYGVYLIDIRTGSKELFNNEWEAREWIDRAYPGFPFYDEPDN